MLFAIFSLGAILYVLIELLWRGKSHLSMALAGGTSLLLLFGLRGLPLILFCLFGSVLITAVEFLTGSVVNLWLRLDVWDYSGRKHNLYGQVCLRYTGYWALLCVPAYFLLDFVYRLPFP